MRRIRCLASCAVIRIANPDSHPDIPFRRVPTAIRARLLVCRDVARDGTPPERAARHNAACRWRPPTRIGAQSGDIRHRLRCPCATRKGPRLTAAGESCELPMLARLRSGLQPRRSSWDALQIDPPRWAAGAELEPRRLHGSSGARLPGRDPRHATSAGPTHPFSCLRQ